ncbi:MAG: S8 family peptidase [Sphingobacteriaceae bacterium]|nr:S8 family peptidase [Sphingobacteriaceae bacterium]
MKKILLLTFICNLILIELSAQTKYWVRFNTKNGTPYSISNPSVFLTARSIQRRVDYSINVHESDLPVNPSFISQIASVPGANVIYASKWLNGVVISATSAAVLTSINNFSFVSSTTPVTKYKVNFPEVSNSATPLNYQSKSNAATHYYGRSYWQNKQLGLDCIHEQGKKGQGIVIAVLDAGFSGVDINPVFDSLRARGGILGTRDFVSGGNSVYEDHFHGAAVLSIMAAVVPSLIVGTAPQADYWLLRTEDAPTEKIIEEYNWIRGAEFADSVGADILTTSLGYTEFDISSQNHTYATLNGKTAPMSIAATMAARKGMLVLNAAGNEGNNPWNFISVPADADSICTVGAVDSLVLHASFSSKGPTADGRRKPDFSARGVATWVSWQSNGACEAGNGTSYATPAVAGALACFWQAHKNFNNIKVIDTLKKSSSHHMNPDNEVGWGIPTMCAIPVGLNKNKSNEQTQKLKVYPNPFTNSISIFVDALKNQTFKISIYNAIGQEVFTSQSDSYNFNLDLTDLGNGFYFIHVKSLNYSETKKIIKN